MAITPGSYNMTVQRRSDHNVQLVFKDSSNDAINLTGFTVEAQVWEETRTTKYADFTVTGFLIVVMLTEVMLYNPLIQIYYLPNNILSIHLDL